jgi:hypothetical protein
MRTYMVSETGYELSIVELSLVTKLCEQQDINKWLER